MKVIKLDKYIEKSSSFFAVNGGQKNIDYLLAYSQQLQEAYEAYQSALDTFQNKTVSDFFQVIKSMPESLSEDFKKSCRYLLKHK